MIYSFFDLKFRIFWVWRSGWKWNPRQPAGSPPKKEDIVCIQRLSEILLHCANLYRGFDTQWQSDVLRFEISTIRGICWILALFSNSKAWNSVFLYSLFVLGKKRCWLLDKGSISPCKLSFVNQTSNFNLGFVPPLQMPLLAVEWVRLTIEGFLFPDLSIFQFL